MGVTSSKVSAKDNLYELLNVTADADDIQLKKAYRKKALELHPDRNINNVEQATKQFADVQAAYDILSDPQERAWYDNRCALGKYDHYVADITSASEVRKVTMEQLSKLPTLEYSLIMAYFQKLKHEEQEAAFSQGLSHHSVYLDYPDFGNRSEVWEKVQHFYNVWGNFTTVKDFNWEDKYPVHAAQDQKTKRKFVQKNMKLREMAKRDFNAAVRHACAKLRQHDIRKPVLQNKKIKKQRSKPIQSYGLLVADQEWQKDKCPTGPNSVECLVCGIKFDTEIDLSDHKRTTTHKSSLDSLKIQHSMETLSLVEGKAKAKAKKKKNSVPVLICGTCGVNLPGPELMKHKTITRHP